MYEYRLKQIDYDGSFNYSAIVEVTIGTPAVFTLEQNYPNPFNPSTTIKFSTPEESSVKISIYNLLAEEIAVLINESLKAGYHQVEWRGVDKNNKILPTGVYFYRIEAKDFVEVKKMMLIK
jgi:flagellar hook assembly protein FlgD